jgi:hypothetical protein
MHFYATLIVELQQQAGQPRLLPYGAKFVSLFVYVNSPFSAVELPGYEYG